MGGGEGNAARGKVRRGGEGLGAAGREEEGRDGEERRSHTHSLTYTHTLTHVHSERGAVKAILFRFSLMPQLKPFRRFVRDMLWQLCDHDGGAGLVGRRVWCLWNLEEPQEGDGDGRAAHAMMGRWFRAKVAKVDVRTGEITVGEMMVCVCVGGGGEMTVEAKDVHMCV